jgi:hypothetical protein
LHLSRISEQGTPSACASAQQAPGPLTAGAWAAEDGITTFFMSSPQSKTVTRPSYSGPRSTGNGRGERK